MSTTKQTAEPWSLYRSNEHSVELINDDGDLVFLERFDSTTPASIRRQAESRALRIMACVNACAGMENPAQSLDQARTALKGLRTQNQQRWDEITEILKLLGDT